MLTQTQKMEIRNIRIFKCAYTEINGKAYKNDGSEFIIPSFVQIRNTVFNKILNSGFKKIELVSPSEANCIIRIFQKLHYKHDDNEVCNVYGVYCYTKKGKTHWFTTDKNGNESEINYSKLIIHHWISQDEYILFDSDFFDCYVRIS